MRILGVLCALAVIAVFASESVAADQGEAKFQAMCASCHGKAGVGTTMAPALVKNEFVKTSKPEDITKVILEGRTGKDKKYPKMPMAMPAQKGKLKDDETKALVDYLKKLSPEDAAAKPAAAKPAAAKPATKPAAKPAAKPTTTK
ncbi:MAG: cytochrome c [Deltaproteobacteria bacterium]|nr:cytochrome c [Deltaproteobacteria bacterium]